VRNSQRPIRQWHPCSAVVPPTPMLIAFWKGEEWRLELSEKNNPIDLRSKSHPEMRMLAKRDLLEGALNLVSGEEGLTLFLSALKRAPYDPDFAEIAAIRRRSSKTIAVAIDGLD